MEKINIQFELQCILQWRQEHVKATARMPTPLLDQGSHQGDDDYWVVLIRELVDVAGYTYSRIAKRMNVSPSTIQKLATQSGRRPRQHVLFLLMCLYYRVFYGPYRSPQIIQFVTTQGSSILARIPQTVFSDIPLS